jgi:exosortase family protein XrtF
LILKIYFQQYKPFLLFLGKFFLSYLVLTFLYQWYLSGYGAYKIDFLTKMVSRHTEWLLQLINKNSFVIEDDKPNLFLKIIYNNKFVARIIEGCNAVSVIILFVAFIFAFSGRVKSTLIYIFIGSGLIYILNVFRIAILTVLIYHFPAQEQLLHGVLFPLFIYGIVFLLWIFWVNRFTNYAKK